MAQANGEGSFERLIDTILRDYYDTHPGAARSLGLHQYDGKVEDYRPEAINERVKTLDRQIQQLDDLDATALSTDQVFNRDLVKTHLAFERFELTRLRDHTRNPIHYADAIDLSGYLKRTYASIDERVRSLGEQAARIPAVLEQAKRNLMESLPTTFIETALSVYGGAAPFIRVDVPAALKAAGATVDISAELAAAADAVDHFIDYLKEAQSRATDDFTIGADAFAEMLRLGEMVDTPLETLLAVGEEDLARNSAAAVEAAAAIDPDRSIREIMTEMAADHPSGSDLVPATARMLESLRDYVIERAIVTIPSDNRCLVEETPSFLRWAFAMMDTAGPFETKARESYYYITPPEIDWPEERKAEWLTVFNYAGLQDISIHEAYPGHFVHFLHLPGIPYPARQVFMSYAFVEGWAHYVEQMMLDIGYGDGDPRLRLAQIKEALTRDCRYIASIKMHTRGMTVDEATRLFMEKTFAEEVPARQEAVRGTFDPGYLNYTLGKLMILKLREDYRREQGPSFSLLDFHDRLLGLGAPPVPLARWAMLRQDVGATL
jgi:uncharacterized protein (DUF885 family)